MSARKCPFIPVALCAPIKVTFEGFRLVLASQIASRPDHLREAVPGEYPNYVGTWSLTVSATTAEVPPYGNQARSTKGPRLPISLIHQLRQGNSSAELHFLPKVRRRVSQQPTTYNLLLSNHPSPSAHLSTITTSILIRRKIHNSPTPLPSKPLTKALEHVTYLFIFCAGTNPPRHPRRMTSFYLETTRWQAMTSLTFMRNL